MERTATQCRDCQDRYVGCHSECESYQLFRAEKEKQYQRKMRNHDTMNYSTDLFRKLTKRGWK